MNTNIAESYAEKVIESVNEFTKESVLELLKQAYIDGASGVAVSEDVNDFVDDGVRYMLQASMEERRINEKILCDLLEEFNLMDKVEFLK